MPVVRVDMWKGRTEEEKEKLIKGITRAFVEIGMKAEWVTVILDEIPKNNCGIGGKKA
ncbi:MAG: 2-hydroxymuconate tautomerase family protein [Candidatus Bathyarchaeota archaeon]|nr:2-hydroxymuconate tautomerase family protein [Candidatus Bathyarchaeota archaeon]